MFQKSNLDLVGFIRKGKQPILMWTTEEKVILANLWVDASEDKTTCNSQTSYHFWRGVKVQFYPQIWIVSIARKSKLTPSTSKQDNDRSSTSPFKLFIEKI